MAEGDKNPQAGARVSLMGRLDPTRDERHARRFLARHPQARSYAGFADFNFYRMSVSRARYVGGFAKAAWIEGRDLVLGGPGPAAIASCEAGVVEHMNEDHRDANQLILKLIHNIEADDVAMTTLVSDGCYLRANEKNYFIQFETPCHDGMSVRKELVRLTKAARSQAEAISA